MGNYLSMAEFNLLMEQVMASYGGENPIVFETEFGKTVQNRPMKAYTVLIGAS